MRGDVLDHVLLSGPPGLGKTTLAYVIAHEMDSAIKVTSGPALTRPSDLIGILTHLIDEGLWGRHRLVRVEAPPGLGRRRPASAPASSGGSAAGSSSGAGSTRP